ncbi:S-adenosyl-L-methionine-dependent methyltransferase [Lojkania enalia]|uniref:S-adenosyl-L-methionine-dependent methyltransferase n=1 Tax=Lojkania enalia TaxID=147567 RepID=A0A9P4MUE5_9PLEO|nr:S-adenosyl-L-methionine-dependent methyltransferase [Didymosphaeria enalia]
MSASDPFVNTLRKFYNDVGDKYDRGQMGEWHQKAADILVDASGSSVKEGSWVLDLATGTGNVAFAAAAKVGPSGQVLGIDISENFLEHAKSTATELGLDTFVEFINQDVTHLSLPSKYSGHRPFDAAFCGSAVMLFPDSVAIVRKVATELLKPGGIFVADTHGSIPGAVFFDIVRSKGIETVLDPAWGTQPGETLRRVFEDSGMIVKEIISNPRSTGIVKWDVRTPEARNTLWENTIIKAPWVSFGMKISAEELAELKSTWEEGIMARAQSDGFIHDDIMHYVAVSKTKN